MDLKRVALHEHIPLQSPFSLHIFPTTHCNFKCTYCIHSLPKDKLIEKNFKREFLDFDVYKKAIDDLFFFDARLKCLLFSGYGEPLMHEKISEMIRYAKSKNVAERIELVTNGSLLSTSMSKKLIEAGLDRLRVSIQGIGDAAYLETAGVSVDFKKIVDNVRYFYENKGNANLYVKIIDIALKKELDEENRFHEIFDEISDVAAVEFAVPVVNEICADVYKNGLEKSKLGHKVTSAKICPMPFYMLALLSCGSVAPCCNPDFPLVYGDASKSSLKQFWNARSREDFLALQIVDNCQNSICKNCTIPKFSLQPGDYLDDHAKQLMTKFSIGGV